MDISNGEQNLKSGLVSLTNGESLYIHVCGTGKEILLMIPALTVDHRSFDVLIPYLENNFKMVIPDLRGHGQSNS